MLPRKWFCSRSCICVTHLIQYLPFLWKHHFNLYQRVTQAQIHLHTFCQQCSTKYFAQPYRSLFSGCLWIVCFYWHFPSTYSFCTEYFWHLPEFPQLHPCPLQTQILPFCWKLCQSSVIFKPERSKSFHDYYHLKEKYFQFIAVNCSSFISGEHGGVFPRYLWYSAACWHVLILQCWAVEMLIGWLCNLAWERELSVAIQDCRGARTVPIHRITLGPLLVLQRDDFPSLLLHLEI